MNKNNTVDTAQKGQTTNNIKKSKTPAGKVVLMKETEARKKAREEQYRNFRVNALKRRCKRMGIPDEKTEEYIKKLLEQLSSPNSYKILIMFSPKEIDMVKQALKNEGLTYDMMADSYVMLRGDQEVLATIRSIMPPSAKIHPYAMKKPSVIPEAERKKEKKPTNNTAEVKKKAKLERKAKNMHTHSSDVYCKNGRYYKRRKPSPRPNRGTNKTKVRIGKRAWLKANTTQAILSLAERVSKQRAIVVQMKAKKSSTATKTALNKTMIPRRRMQQAA